ncbi:MAG: hypothetical protein PVJ75_16010, partial [Chloroflexota bacterium]
MTKRPAYFLSLLALLALAALACNFADRVLSGAPTALPATSETTAVPHVEQSPKFASSPTPPATQPESEQSSSAEATVAPDGSAELAVAPGFGPEQQESFQRLAS